MVGCCSLENTIFDRIPLKTANSVIAYIGIVISVIAVIGSGIRFALVGSNEPIQGLPSWFFAAEAVLISSGCGFLILGVNQDKRRFVAIFLAFVSLSAVVNIIFVLPWILRVIEYDIGLTSWWAQFPLMSMFCVPFFITYLFIYWIAIAFIQDLRQSKYSTDKVPCVVAVNPADVSTDIPIDV